MPIYEYWCDVCQKEFEQMRPMSQSADPAACPTCDASSEKLPSVFASKAEYTIKVPRSGALRQHGQAASAQAEAPATATTPASA
jgi:putative FmdB family regulatory protein